MNTSQLLNEAGQSVWYDNIQRALLVNGEMARMIGQGEIRGVTSNPTIFMNAIAKSHDYDAGLAPLAKAGCSAEEIYYALAIEDIKNTADLFRPLYEATQGGDGYVSLEVSPYKANDTAATVEEAVRLWGQLKRPNLMIKIPATRAGLPAITAAIAEGLNINVTLIFDTPRYAEVADAYMAGLEQCLANGLPIDKIASVASLFVSRVDTKIDARLAKINTPEAEALQGKAGIANTCLVYMEFKKLFGSERFKKLAAHGARVQRPLWASTGTKNPKYSDVLYVDELVVPHTVNTMPPQTLAAVLDHGRVAPNKLETYEHSARVTLEALEAAGISFAEVAQQLEDEGVKSFADAFTELLSVVEQRRLECVRA